MKLPGEYLSVTEKVVMPGRHILKFFPIITLYGKFGVVPIVLYRK